jgi:hypothetical protein
MVVLSTSDLLGMPAPVVSLVKRIFFLKSLALVSGVLSRRYLYPWLSLVLGIDP